MTKQETLTDEQVAFIVAWATGGNEAKPLTTAIPIDVQAMVYPIRGRGAGNMVTLSRSALTIAALASENAKLRAALEQACETAEECQPYVDQYFREKWEIDPMLEIMRENKMDLLK